MRDDEREGDWMDAHYRTGDPGDEHVEIRDTQETLRRYENHTGQFEKHEDFMVEMTAQQAIELLKAHGYLSSMRVDDIIEVIDRLDNELIESRAACDEAQQETRRLDKALAWYADERNWEGDPKSEFYPWNFAVISDEGRRAREARNDNRLAER